MKRLLPKRFDEKDIQRWTAYAKKEGRSLNNWMEYKLNKASAAREVIKKKRNEN